jgi:uncharacterized protein YecT (DUF1311 family)
MRRLNPTVLALLGGVVILVLVLVYFATNRNPDQDKLTGNQTAQAGAPNPEKRCAAQSTYDLIKRELFRRAAELRGSDQAAYDRLASYAVVRMENPVMESGDANNGAIHCSGSLSLDLPPGVAAVGGRRSLMADIDYTVQPAADGSGDVVLLSNADPIITPLATLARTTPAPLPSPSVAPIQSNSVAPPQANGVAPEAPRPAPTPAPNQPPATRPSFDCTKARSRGEAAVCSDGGLAALDRSMAAQYGHAMATATPEQQALLRRTRSRFLAYRDRCPDRQCMGDAYVGRMREIRDIMEGHWRAPR